jgi:hypothetical protein
MWITTLPKENKEMAEETFLNEGEVTVTNARFIVPSQTHAMSGITSVKNLRHDPSRKGPIVLIVIGLFALANGAAQDALPAALMFLAGGIGWWVLQKPEFTVVLSSSSSESKALVSKDGAFISRVVDALNRAIIARG